MRIAFLFDPPDENAVRSTAEQDVKDGAKVPLPFQHFRVVHLGVPAMRTRRGDELVVLDVEYLRETGAGRRYAFDGGAVCLTLAAYEPGCQLFCE
jgi:hypothetical protein